MQTAEASFAQCSAEFYAARNVASYAGMPRDARLSARFKGVAEHVNKVLALVTDLEQRSIEWPADLRSRIMRLDFKAVAILVRINLITSNLDTTLLGDDVIKILFSAIQKFELCHRWFQCKDDFECQKALYFLYEILMSLPKSPESKLKSLWLSCRQDNGYMQLMYFMYEELLRIMPELPLPTAGFVPGLFLRALMKKCDPSLVKLTVLQSFLMESCIEFLDRNPADDANTKVVAQYRSEFDGLHRQLVLSRQSLERTPKNYKYLIELARAHFVAYRYNLVCSHYNQAVAHKRPLSYFIERGRDGEWEKVVMHPQLSDQPTTAEIIVLIEEEKRLRKEYYHRCLELLESLDFGLLPEDIDLQAFLLVFISEAQLQANCFNGYIRILLEAHNSKKINLEPRCAHLLGAFGKELDEISERWMALFRKHRVGSLEKLLEALPEGERKELFRVALSNECQGVEGIVLSEQTRRLAAVKQQEDDFAELETKSSDAMDELQAWDEERKKQYELIRAKRRAALSARKDAPPGSSERREDVDTLETDEPAVVVVSETKSEPLHVLILHDDRASILGKELLKQALFIKRILNQKDTNTKRTPDNDLADIGNLLNNSLKGYEDLLLCYNRYPQLIERLTANEKIELMEGIEFSLQKVGKLIKDVQHLLGAASDLLQRITEKAEQERAAFIARLGKDAAAELGGVIALTPEQIFKLGWHVFKKLGAKRRDEGLPISDASLKLQYLKSCNDTYQTKLRELKKYQLPEYEVLKSNIQVDYPKPLKEKLKVLRAVPGDHFLFDDALLDVVLERAHTKTNLNVLNFVTTCASAGQVFTAKNQFQTSIYDQQLCRMKLAGTERVNLFLSTQSLPKMIALKEWAQQGQSHLFFTIDLVLGDLNGNIFDLTGRGVSDAKSYILKMIGDPVQVFQQHPQALLIALKRMAQGYQAEPELKEALSTWQLSPAVNVQYLKAVLREQLQRLTPEQCAQFAKLFHQYGMFKKIFARDCAHLPEDMLLTQLGVLAQEGKTGFDPTQFAAAPVLVAPAVIATDQHAMMQAKQ